MERFLKYSLTALAILSATSTFAQKRWTLEECITYALQNNIQIKRNDLQTKTVEKSYQQGFYNFAPSINGTYYHDYTNGNIYSQYYSKFINVVNQSGSVSINAEIELFKGLSNWNNLTKLRYELLSQKENSEIQKNNITLNIVAAYLQVLFDNESLNYSKEQYDILKLQLQKAEKQSELGNISIGDMLSIKAQTINQKATLTSAQNKVQLAYLDLSQLLEIDSISSFKINILPIRVVEKDAIQEFSTVYNEMLSKRPELRKADYDVKSARKELNVAYGSLSPRVVMGYSIGSGYDRSAFYRKVSGVDTVVIKYPDYTYKKQLQDYVSNRIYLSVQIPIFQRLTNVTRISKAKINLLDAKYAQEETQKKVLKDVQLAYTEAIASYDKYLAFQESVESYNEVFELAKQKFELGMINSIDYEVAHNNLQKAQGDLLHAKYSYLFKLKILDFYRGIPITL